MLPVQTVQPFYGQTHLLECGFQLEATPGNVTRFRVVQQANRGVFWNLIAIFGNALPDFPVLPLHTVRNQALGLGAGGGQLTLD